MRLQAVQLECRSRKRIAWVLDDHAVSRRAQHQRSEMQRSLRTLKHDDLLRLRRDAAELPQVCNDCFL
jgi:hypothetical protein